MTIRHRTNHGSKSWRRLLMDENLTDKPAIRYEDAKRKAESSLPTVNDAMRKLVASINPKINSDTIDPQDAIRLTAQALLASCTHPLRPCKPSGNDPEADLMATTIEDRLVSNPNPLVIVNGCEYIGKTRAIQTMEWRCLHHDRVPNMLDGCRIVTLNDEALNDPSSVSYMAWSEWISNYAQIPGQNVIIHTNSARVMSTLPSEDNLSYSVPIIIESDTDNHDMTEDLETWDLIIEGLRICKINALPRYDVRLAGKIFRSGLCKHSDIFMDRFGYVPSLSVVTEAVRAECIMAGSRSEFDTSVAERDLHEIMSGFHASRNKSHITAKDYRLMAARKYKQKLIMDDECGWDMRTIVPDAAVKPVHPAMQSIEPDPETSTGEISSNRELTASLTVLIDELVRRSKNCSAAERKTFDHEISKLLLSSLDRAGFTMTAERPAGGSEAHKHFRRAFTSKADLLAKMKTMVIGQDDQLERVVRPIVRRRAGFRTRSKPIGGILLAGPSGCGKTETAISLAKILYGSTDHMLRIDCSSLKSHEMGVATLLGSGKGYVGSNEGGMLTNWVRSHPDGIVVFDEIEKAAPEISDAVLIPMLDYGVITDGSKGKVDCSGLMIILTSNLGSGSVKKDGVNHAGFNSTDDDKDWSVLDADVLSAVRKEFRPEVMNRLTDVIVYHPLSVEDYEKIFKMTLSTKGKSARMILSPSDRAVKWFAVHGKADNYGARSIERMIDDMIINPLADMIISDGKIKRVSIDISDGAVVLTKTASASSMKTRHDLNTPLDVQ